MIQVEKNIKVINIMDLLFPIKSGQEFSWFLGILFISSLSLILLDEKGLGLAIVIGTLFGMLPTLYLNTRCRLTLPSVRSTLLVEVTEILTKYGYIYDATNSVWRVDAPPYLRFARSNVEIIVQKENIIVEGPWLMLKRMQSDLNKIA